MFVRIMYLSTATLLQVVGNSLANIPINRVEYKVRWCTMLSHIQRRTQDVELEGRAESFGKAIETNRHQPLAGSVPEKFWIKIPHRSSDIDLPFRFRK